MRTRSAAVVLAGALLLTGCGGTDEPSAQETRTPSPSASPSAPTSPSPPASPGTTLTPRTPPARPAPGTVPPPWLGTRVLPEQPGGFGEVRPTPRELQRRRFTLPDRLLALPGAGFASQIASPAPNDVLRRSTWEPGCPVGRDDLAWVRLTFWGFDDRRHTGELLVHRTVARPLVRVFGELYRARFPIEEMRITRRAELDAPPTGDGNNTGVFVCRATTGATSYSQHAYGLAVDLNPFHNPYVTGDLVLPELASAFLDRDRARPGMVDDEVVRAFARIGWGWGGSWQTLKDYQHFSRDNR